MKRYDLHLYGMAIHNTVYDILYQQKFRASSYELTLVDKNNTSALEEATTRCMENIKKALLQIPKPSTLGLYKEEV